LHPTVRLTVTEIMAEGGPDRVAIQANQLGTPRLELLPKSAAERGLARTGKARDPNHQRMI
jgi:hypothetical protein